MMDGFSIRKQIIHSINQTMHLHLLVSVILIIQKVIFLTVQGKANKMKRNE